MILKQGEQQLGRYQVQFARFGRRGWQSHGPSVCAFITNRRLIVLPDETLTDQKPMVITPRKIRRVWRAALGKRDGGIIELRDGELLYFYVEWSQGAQLVRDLKQMIGFKALPESGTATNNKQIMQ